MSGYRDERDALRLRLEQLERELSDAQHDTEREKLAHGLGAIATQVREARTKLEQDRQDLAKIAAAIARLRPAGSDDADRAPDDASDGADTTSPSSPTEPRENVTHGSGTLTVGGMAVGAVGLLVALVVATTTSPCARPTAGPDAVSADDVPGFPHAVDPSAALTEARKHGRFDGSWRLAGMTVRYATEDGLVDLGHPKYQAAIRYEFVETKPPAPPPADSSIPLGAPVPLATGPGGLLATGSNTGAIELGRDGWHVDSFAGFLPGTNATPLAGPECSVGEVWAAARKAGAPAGAVAVIDYEPALGLQPPQASATLPDSPRPGQWSIRIEGTDFARIVDDPGCTVRDAPR